MKQVPLTQGQVALVDDEDYEIVRPFHWCARWSQRTRSFYAIRRREVGGHKQTELMHRVILGLTDPKIFTDHIDGDGLNNRRSNLRVCTVKENARNRRKHTQKTSRFKGVTLRRSAGRWEAKIRVAGKLIYLGHFMTEEDAALAYNAAAIKHFGEFANLNPVAGVVPAPNKHEGYSKKRRRS